MNFETADFWAVVPYVLFGDFTFWLIRYGLIAGTAFAFIFFVARVFLPQRRIQRREPGEGRRLQEIGWSLSTIVIFALLAMTIFALRESGYSAVYDRIDDYGWLYYGFSWALVLLIQDAYFYWIHRFMHWKPVYRRVHSVHHRSTNPSPFSALAFHPLEAFLEFFYFVPLIVVLPLHWSVLVGYPTFMLLANVYAHLGYELLPRGFARSSIGRYLLTSTLHNAHHKKFHYNYGFYFYWWDRWFGTLDPEYETDFRKPAEAIAHKPVQKAAAAPERELTTAS